MDADRVLTAVLSPSADPAGHPLAGWVQSRETAHLGVDAFDRADADSNALPEALGYYQAGVAVVELSLPPPFAGVLAHGRSWTTAPSTRRCTASG
ncbi:hypothetical protein [Kitasatospora sp. NPDC002040]|uniref:hypothetical protein n=1 Tax=Kitasatospora sp. NPDC002040 TaxID=3154661 RepID=UPI0033323CAF